PIERDEELGALMEIEDKLDYTSLNNLIKTKVNNPANSGRSYQLKTSCILI
ncbi:hypothetical protein RhiirB3_409174, partial [Rhizophagus irregularis]